MQNFTQLATFMVLFLRLINNGLYLTDSDNLSGNQTLVSIESRSKNACFLRLDQTSAEDIRMGFKDIKALAFLDLTANPYKISERLLNLTNVPTIASIYKIQLQSCSELDQKAEKDYNKTNDLSGGRTIVFICQELDAPEDKVMMDQKMIILGSRPTQFKFRFSYKKPSNKKSFRGIFMLNDTASDNDCENLTGSQHIDHDDDGCLSGSLREISSWSYNSDCSIRCSDRALPLKADAPKLARKCKSCHRCAKCKQGDTYGNGKQACNPNANYGTNQLKRKQEDSVSRAIQSNLLLVPPVVLIVASCILLQFYLARHNHQHGAWVHYIHANILTVVLIFELILTSQTNLTNYSHNRCNLFCSLVHFRLAASGLMLPQAKLLPRNQIESPTQTQTTTKPDPINIILICANYSSALLIYSVRQLWFFESNANLLKACIAYYGTGWLALQIMITFSTNIILLFRNRTTRINLLIFNLLIGFAFGLVGQLLFLGRMRNELTLLDDQYVSTFQYSCVLCGNFYGPIKDFLLPSSDHLLDDNNVQTISSSPLATVAVAAEAATDTYDDHGDDDLQRPTRG